MPWLSPGSNDSGGVLDDGCQPSCVEMVEITGLLPAATARIGGQRKYLNAAGKGKVGRTPVVDRRASQGGKAVGGPSAWLGTEAEVAVIRSVESIIER